MDSYAIKIKLDGDREGLETLDGQSRICNWLYNHLLQQALDLKKNYIETQNSEIGKTLYTERGLRNLLPKIKEENPFLKVVHSSPLKNTALRLSNSIRMHQKTKKTGRPTSWPKFRSWKEKWFSLLYDEPNKGFAIEGNQLILSLGMGEDRKRRNLILHLSETSPLEGKKIRNLRIVSELGEYFAIFTIERELPKKKSIKKILALDPNHKNLSYGVDNEGHAIEIRAPFWLKAYETRIDELKAKRDRCLRKSKKVSVCNDKGEPTGKEYFIPSRRWKRYDLTLKKALRKRRDQTKTFMYTLSKELCQRYDLIAIGDYTPDGSGENKKMRRAMNNRSLIGRFKETLSWSAKKTGKTFHEFDEKGTTRKCHHCHHVVSEGLSPSIRVWRCEGCQTEHLRDENAAMNGLHKVIRDFSKKIETQVSSVSCSDPAFIKKRWDWCALPSGVVITSRGQSRGSTPQHQVIKTRAMQPSIKNG
jgi:putative transposase